MRTRPTWIETWLTVAGVIGQRSRCDLARAGAVITDAENRCIATGYNGPPAGYVQDESSCVEWCERAQAALGIGGNAERDPHYADCPSEHAERNALNFVDRSRARGGTIYISTSMCVNCAKGVANSGLSGVVMMSDDHPHRRMGEVVNFLEHCGVRVQLVERDETNDDVSVGGGDGRGDGDHGS